MKSKLNKTIDFSMDEAGKYLKDAIYEKDLVEPNNKLIIDETIIGDFFTSIEFVEDKSIDLLIVDPPYNIRKDYHGNVFNEMSKQKYDVYTRSWLEKVIPKLKDNASVYICCDWKSSMVIGPILAEHLIIRNRITWQREKGRGSKMNWKNSMEDIWYATKSDQYTFNIDQVKIRKKVIAPYKDQGKPKDWESTEKGNFRNTHPSNFWDDITIPFWSMPENTAHPTQKPEKLIAKLILASTNVGDVVLDPFMGSGTTGVVAKKLGRKYIGIEQNPLYVAWGKKRLEDAKKDSSIQGYEDGVFWDRNSRN